MVGRRDLVAGRREMAARVAQLHERHAEQLWRYVVHMTADPHLAEDIVQETLLRALRDPGTLERDADHQRSWLFVVARNLMVDGARSARNRREVNSVAPPEKADPDQADDLLDRWLIADALASLSTAHRDVIVRAYHGDMSVAAIAEELDVAPGTVKSRLHHGLRALRLALVERGVSGR
jgi:RNA polymerase sigma-70 factor, ECF subfamily